MRPDRVSTALAKWIGEVRARDAARLSAARCLAPTVTIGRARTVLVNPPWISKLE